MDALQSVLDNIVDGKKVFGTSFAIKKGSVEWSGSSGNFAHDQSYFVASVSKLFTTAIVLHLASQGRLTLEDKISQYLDNSVLEGLHIYKGKDYSRELTIKHLLAHTSGLPDYFEGKDAAGKSLKADLTSGNDQSWTFEQVIKTTKKAKSHFSPGTKNKAHYSDTNFQLLGKIVEIITSNSFAANCKDTICSPIGMSNTYLYTESTDPTPKTLYYKSNELVIPKAMTSFGPDGGVVSTSIDMLSFIESFFTGRLFPSKYIVELQEWNRIYFPVKSGIGIQLFKLPWYLSPMGSIPKFIGHSGLSGALAYYSPEESLYVAGTVNQVAHPAISFKTMIKLTQALRR